jgi:hypothetical protein
MGPVLFLWTFIGAVEETFIAWFGFSANATSKYRGRMALRPSHSVVGPRRGATRQA